MRAAISAELVIMHGSQQFPSTPAALTAQLQKLHTTGKKLHFHNICPMSIASGLLTACTVYLVGFCQNTEKSWRWKWDVGRIHLSSYLQNYSHPILVVVLRQTFVRWNIMKTGANVQCAYICLSVPRQSKRKTWSWQWLWLLKRNPTLLIMIPYVEKLLSVLWPGGKVQTCSEGQGQHGRMILLW